MLTLLASVVLMLLPIGGNAPASECRPSAEGSEWIAQKEQSHQQAARSKRIQDGHAVIGEVERGLLRGDVRAFSKYFAAQIYLSLRGAESGYFSANQAVLIVDNYLSGRRTVTFKFSTVNVDDPMPYATGGGSFFVRGTMENLQIYVALARENSRWVITQFNVY